MKPNLKLIATAAILATASAVLPSCGPSVTAEETTTADFKYGVPGGKVTKVTELNATVTAIDAAKRKVTLVTRAGEKTTVTAGPEVVNFPQIQVGDQLKVSYTEEVMIRMAKPGEKIKEDATADVHLSPEGGKPGMGIGTSGLMTATVTKIDPKSRKATLLFSDESSAEFKVRDDIDLSKHHVGERVVIQTKEAFAVEMKKP